MTEFRSVVCTVFVALACLQASAQVPVASAGQADGPERYSHTLELGVSGKDSLVQLQLPKEVYQASRSPHLADLRIFDQQGQIVPFAILDTSAQAQVSYRTTSVAIFPVMAQLDGNERPSLDIRTSADGTLVSVNARSQDGGKRTTSKLASLVLDMRAEEQAGAAASEISALRLTLPPSVDNYTARIALEVSDDLKHWENLGESLVSWMKNADTKVLASDRIEFDSQAFRYARLSWREGTPLVFSSVVAERRTRTESRRQIDTMVLTPQPGKLGKDFVYHVAPAIPVQSFGLLFSAENVVLPALVGRYVELPVLKDGQSKRWDFQPDFRATFFRLTQSGKIRTSGDVTIGESHVAEWVVRPLASVLSTPTLRISWQPARIVFLAAGKKPYSLRIGRDAATSAAVDIANVAPGFVDAELLAIEQAATGQLVQQRAATFASSEADMAAISARGRSAILWCVLLIGVLVLALMVRHLVKQMPAAPQE